MKPLDCSSLRYILLDIEGTCSDIHFVKEVLFPYSARELRNFLSENRHTPKVVEALRGLSAQDLEGATIELQRMIREDVKHPSLKSLQGMIWKKGFESGEFKSPLYPDVEPALKKWRAQGLRLGIYSSGSVAAQKLFWKHTELGDFTNYFGDHFDLEIGGKKEPASYQKIAQSTGCTPQQILFLSDLPDEIRAALAAGLRALQIVRPGTAPTQLQSAAQFGQIC
jgi:enolase-phosphatase E1